MVCSNDQTVLTGVDVAVEDIRLLSKQDLLHLADVLDSETYEVKRTTFVYLDGNDDPWFGVIAGKGKQDVTVEEIKDSLTRVPDSTFPQALPSFTIAREDLLQNYHVKRPKLILLDVKEEAELIPQLFLDEIQILEFLIHHPHPNIVRYHGCRVKQGRVTGILLDRHETTLQYYFRDKGERLEKDSFLKNLHAGVKHLHSLGLGHNDLNPANILVDQEKNPIIIDFDSCRKFGQRLLSGGTPGWMDEEYETSEQRNDEAALRRITNWLRDQERSN